MPTKKVALPVGEPGMMAVVNQRATVLEAQIQVKLETYRFAELLNAQDGTDHVTIASAARACGITKGYATSLVHRFRRGELDPTSADDVKAEVAALRQEAARLQRRIDA